MAPVRTQEEQVCIATWLWLVVEGVLAVSGGGAPASVPGHALTFVQAMQVWLVAQFVHLVSLAEMQWSQHRQQQLVQRPGAEKLEVRGAVMATAKGPLYTAASLFEIHPAPPSPSCCRWTRGRQSRSCRQSWGRQSRGRRQCGRSSWRRRREGCPRSSRCAPLPGVGCACGRLCTSMPDHLPHATAHAYVSVLQEQLVQVLTDVEQLRQLALQRRLQPTSALATAVHQLQPQAPGGAGPSAGPTAGPSAVAAAPGPQVGGWGLKHRLRGHARFLGVDGFQAECYKYKVVLFCHSKSAAPSPCPAALLSMSAGGR